jgi:hypothetical protein
VHYADANDVEIDINTKFFESIESIFGPESNVDLDRGTTTVVDFVVEGRKQERGQERGPTVDVRDITFSFRDLLIHIPVQLWPLPHESHCPCSFCDECPEPSKMELHLATRHSRIFLSGAYYTEIHLQLAGLLGIDVFVQKRNAWKCPFAGCERDFIRYAEIREHVLRDHEPDEQFLYSRVGGFWASLLSFYHKRGRWPTIHTIVGADQQTGKDSDCTDGTKLC